MAAFEENGSPTNSPASDDQGEAYSNQPVFPGMPLLTSNEGACPVSNTLQPLYTQTELDMVLYGYAKPKNLSESAMAISCLKTENVAAARQKNRPNLSNPDDIGKQKIPECINVKQSIVAGLVHYSTFCCQPIKKGQTFGPFEGKPVDIVEESTKDNFNLWEIYNEGKLSHFIDGKTCSDGWMIYVNCARYSQEQNLDAVQMDDKLYYQANKDIAVGKELLVWYGNNYDLFMGIPIGMRSSEYKAIEEFDDMKGLEENVGGAYSCERCGKVFAYKYYKEKHLKYTKCVDMGDRKFPCNICSRSFEKKDRLRIHILHVHEKHRPHKCTVCNKCFSQSSSLNKHMRVHSGERPYKCNYCNKAFTASSILRTHIRQHSGEKPFKCKFCGKSFASHAAHDSHVRRTHTKETKPDVSSLMKSDDLETADTTHADID